jgi:hypothetical protein
MDFEALMRMTPIDDQERLLPLDFEIPADFAIHPGHIASLLMGTFFSFGLLFLD